MVTLFLIISALGLLMALGTVLARNLVHAALFLVAFFFVVACQFVLLEAEFLAAMQVLVYIGAVAILMMFGIMLTRNIQGDETTRVSAVTLVLGGIICLGVLVVLVIGIREEPGGRTRPPWSGTASRTEAVRLGQPTDDPKAQAINNMGLAVGREMMTRFAIPFEIAGLLLTAALVGAVALAQNEGDEETPRAGTMKSAEAGSTNGPNNGAPASSAAPEALTSTASAS